MRNDYKQFIPMHHSFSKTNHNSHSSQEKGILSSFAVTLETWTRRTLNTDKNCNKCQKFTNNSFQCITASVRLITTLTVVKRKGFCHHLLLQRNQESWTYIEFNPHKKLQQMEKKYIKNSFHCITASVRLITSLTVVKRRGFCHHLL